MRKMILLVALLLSSSVALADSRQALRKSLQDFNERFNDYTEHGDVDGLVGLYDKDALWIEQNMPVAQGLDAVRQTFSFLASSQAVNKHSVDQLLIAEDGSLAVMVGTAIVQVESLGLDTTGTFLFVLKPHEDSWRIVTDMWHQHVSAEKVLGD